MFGIHGKIHASLSQFFSAVFSISIIYMIHVKFRFTVTLRRKHGKLLPTILIDQVKALKQFFQSASGQQLLGNALLAVNSAESVTPSYFQHPAATESTLKTKFLCC